MNDPQQAARTEFSGGIAHFEANRLELAEAAFLRALALAPGRPSVLRNLGLTQMRLGGWARAAATLQDAMTAGAADAELHLALAECHMQLRNWAGAIAACLAAGGVDALSADQAQSLAAAYLASQQPQAARQTLERALTRYPRAHPLHRLLADMLRSAGLNDLARQHYQQAADSGADPQLMGFFLAALETQPKVEHAPASYVAALFDEYAAEFDHHLVDALGYVGHSALIDGLPLRPGTGWSRVLDLGCGTGLCGQRLRPHCGHLSGVDLSPGMIERARALGVYDQLDVADATAFLQREGAAYDLIVAADVLIYIGGAEPLLSAATRRLAPGGVFGFTVECIEGEGFRLGPDLRFHHSRRYIEHSARAASLQVAEMRLAPIRREQGRWVDGLYVYLRA